MPYILIHNDAPSQSHCEDQTKGTGVLGMLRSLKMEAPMTEMANMCFHMPLPWGWKQPLSTGYRAGTSCASQKSPEWYCSFLLAASRGASPIYPHHGYLFPLRYHGPEKQGFGLTSLVLSSSRHRQASCLTWEFESPRTYRPGFQAT